MGKNTTKQDKAKRNLEYARAHRKPTRPAGRFGRPKFNRPADGPAAAPSVPHQVEAGAPDAATPAD